MTPSRRELILRKQFSNPDEHQATLLQSDELHPTKSDLCVTTGIVGEDDLIGRQGDSEAVREEDEGAWRPVPDNRKRRRPVRFPQKEGRRREIDEQRNVFHVPTARRHLVLRYGGIDEP